MCAYTTEYLEGDWRLDSQRLHLEQILAAGPIEAASRL